MVMEMLLILRRYDSLAQMVLNQAKLSSQAFQELAKGERTATALENQLNVMEARIEALLAEAEKEQEKAEAGKGGKQASSSEKSGSAGSGNS